MSNSIDVDNSTYWRFLLDECVDAVRTISAGGLPRKCGLSEYGAAGVRALPKCATPLPRHAARALRVRRRGLLDGGVVVCRDGVLRDILLSVPRELRDLLYECLQCRDPCFIWSGGDRGLGAALLPRCATHNLQIVGRVSASC